LLIRAFSDKRRRALLYADQNPSAFHPASLTQFISLHILVTMMYTFDLEPEMSVYPYVDREQLEKDLMAYNALKSAA
jgi:hypothetical protein